MSGRMKTLRISDDVHRKLTATLGTLMAQTSKMQTYEDAINALLNQSVKLSPELLTEIEGFIEKNKHLGYITREEFIRDAMRFRLSWLKGEHEYMKIPEEHFKLLKEAVKEMKLPYHNAEDFIHKQIQHILEQYDKWLMEKEENEKTQQKR